jgi:hypothetical protein
MFRNAASTLQRLGASLAGANAHDFAEIEHNSCEKRGGPGLERRAAYQSTTWLADFSSYLTSPADAVSK